MSHQLSPVRRHSTISADRVLICDRVRPMRSSLIKVLNAESAASFNSDTEPKSVPNANEVGGSPQRSECDNSIGFSPQSRGSFTHYIKDEAIGLEIALDAMDSEDLEQIPIQNFHDIERQIGKMGKVPIIPTQDRRKNGSRRSSISISAQSHDRSQTASSFKVNTLPVIEESSLNNTRLSATEVTELTELTNFLQYLLFSAFIIPENIYKSYWDKLLLLTLCYTVIITPFQIALDCSFGDIVYLELVITILFLLDIYISFRTTFRASNNGEYVIDSRYVSRRYLRTWFVCDLLASVPVFEILVLLQADREWQIRFVSLRLFRLSKLYRLRLLPPHSARTGFVVLAVALLFICHWSACILSFSGTAGSSGTSGTSEPSKFEQYIAALHWTITTESESASHSLSDQIYSILGTLIAAVLYSMLFASMSLVFGEMYHSQSQYTKHSTECHQFATELHLSSNLKRRIAALNRYEKEKVYGSNLEYLMRSCNFPNSVKYAILDRTLKPVLIDNGAFRFVTDNILLFMAENLSLSVSLPNEFLFKAHDVMSRVYVVHEGLIRIFNGKLNENSIELCRLTTGSHFGEVSFFQQHEDYLDERITAQSKLSTLSAVSHTFSVLYTLSYADFKEVLLIDPKNYKVFRAIAEHRNKQNVQYDDQQLCQIIASRFNNIGIISGVHFENCADSVGTVQQSDQVP